MPDDPNIDELAATRLNELLDSEDASEEEEVEQPVGKEAPATDEPTEPEDSGEEFFPRADLEALLEGVEDEGARESIVTAYKSFERGFHSKSQEIAANKRALEGIDPVQAREAFEFVKSLTEDRDFALSVHKELSQALEAAGLSPAQASEEAARQIEQTVTESNLGESEIDPNDPLAREVQELRAWQREQEKREQDRQLMEQRNAMIRDIERQDQIIRRDNPSYDEGDMEAIYKIAASTEGDLEVAQEYYEQLKDRFYTGYVAKKKSVKPGVTPVKQGAPGAEEPIVIRNVDEAHALAPEILRRFQEGS